MTISPPTITASPAAPASWRERTLARLVDQVRLLLSADALAFLTSGPSGDIEQAAGWFADETLRHAFAPPDARPFGRSRRGLAELALSRHEPLLIPRLEDSEFADELSRAATMSLGADRGPKAWEQHRTASLIVCPLRGETGTTFGVLVLMRSDPGRPLGGADLGAAQVVADLAAMTLERADLLESELRRGQEEVALKRAAEAISESLELEDVYRRVAENAAALTGASRARLSRFNSRTAELVTVAETGSSAAAGELSVGNDSLAHVVLTRTPMLRRVGEGEGAGSVLHAPLEIGARLYGVLSVAHDQADGLGPPELDLLVRLSRSSAAAVANAIDFERERRIARALTLGFVPGSLPDLPGFETGLLYAPAENQATGGDIYGAWPVSGGQELAVLVGDVAGKGVEIASLSSMVRFFIEARSWDESSPARVLEQANRMLFGRLPRDTFVTAFLAILSPDGLRYSNAGHMQPLVCCRQGLRSLSEAHGLPLGVAEDHDYGEATQELAPGDLVFAYTDGLIEARRSGEIFGAERLSRLVAESCRVLEPGPLVRAVHEEVSAWADGLSDDAVALALKRSA